MSRRAFGREEALNLENKSFVPLWRSLWGSCAGRYLPQRSICKGKAKKLTKRY
ncbi:hypothetical protein KCP77_01010 [Salmonella enterica subsp. enterica]|nr:hypothetical protein KCP77_01010 [Salmonella enterica subsp. enterica]